MILHLISRLLLYGVSVRSFFTFYVFFLQAEPAFRFAWAHILI